MRLGRRGAPAEDSAARGGPRSLSRAAPTTPGALYKKCIVSAESLDFLYISGNFGGPFGAIMADWGPSRPRHPHLEVFADLRSPHESSGARLETDFGHFREKCERILNFSNWHLRNLEFRVWISYQKISYQKCRV